MNEALLRELANSLNVSVEVLWGALIKQAYVFGVMNLILAILVAIVIIAVPLIIKRFWAEIIDDGADVPVVVISLFFIILMVAFLLGWLVYALALRNGKLRKCPTYIGGERLDEARIPGVPEGAERHVEVTGVDFYKTVEELPLLKPLYQIAQKKIIDIYETGGKATGSLVNLLRGAHTGLLPLYLTWFVLGLLAILYVMMKGTP